MFPYTKFSFNFEKFRFRYFNLVTSSGHCNRWPWVSWNRKHEEHQGFPCCLGKFCLTSNVLLLSLKSNCFSLVDKAVHWIYSAIFNFVQLKYSDFECLLFWASRDRIFLNLNTTTPGLFYCGHWIFFWIIFYQLLPNFQLAVKWASATLQSLVVLYLWN